MNKLSKKFIVGISIILSFSCILSILFNTRFLERYYLVQKRNAITGICDELTNKIRRGDSPDDAVSRLESSEKVVIVRIDGPSEIDNDELNDEIRTAFLDKGMGFQKYWLWEEDYKKVLNGENKLRLYKQDKLNYSLLIEYTQIDSILFAVSMVIPNIGDAFNIINPFLIGVNVAGIVLAIILIIILIKRITRPLLEFEHFASHMKENEFIPLNIHTKDELESAADSLNVMGRQIISYQDSLHEKNRQMEQLLDNVAHDLKTPVSLIKLYADGMQDGLDDGTFLKTIQEENQQMAEMVEKLLYVSRIGKKAIEYETVDLSSMLETLIDECTFLAKESKICFSARMEGSILIESSEEMIRSLFANLITNAVKYSSGTQIDIVLEKTETNIGFAITNETDNAELDLSQIWMPYYVGEQSRNKQLSGSGLGLAIVSKVCEQLNYSVQCSLDNNRITFIVKIPLPDGNDGV